MNSLAVFRFVKLPENCWSSLISRYWFSSVLHFHIPLSAQAWWQFSPPEGATALPPNIRFSLILTAAGDFLSLHQQSITNSSALWSHNGQKTRLCMPRKLTPVFKKIKLNFSAALHFIQIRLTLYLLNWLFVFVQVTSCLVKSLVICFR